MLLIIAILAGGQSSRMGTDKALLGVDGRTLLERVCVEAVGTSPQRSPWKGEGVKTVVVGRERPSTWAVDGVDFIPDVEAGLGPIGGLSAALVYAQEQHARPELPLTLLDTWHPPAVLMLACDMPLLSRKSIGWLADEAVARRPASGLAVRNGDQIEPLFSVYQPSVLPVIEVRIGQGRRSLHGLFDAVEFDYVDAPGWVREELVNVNTVEEWRKVKESM